MLFAKKKKLMIVDESWKCIYTSFLSLITIAQKSLDIKLINCGNKINCCIKIYKSQFFIGKTATVAQP